MKARVTSCKGRLSNDTYFALTLEDESLPFPITLRLSDFDYNAVVKHVLPHDNEMETLFETLAYSVNTTLRSDK